MISAFIRSLIDAVNAVQPRVWTVQFVALLGIVALGGRLILNGHSDAGLPIITGAFALLKFEVGGNSNAQ